MTREETGAHVAIATIAFAVMLFEITLLRICSFTIWHHYAFMVISVALLGFGVSGTALQLRPAWGRPAARRAALFALLFAVTGVVAVGVAGRIPFDPARLADEPSQLWYLGGYYLALLLPFSFAGLAIIVLLKGGVTRVGSLYAADLAGAGAGACATVAVLGLVRVEGAVFLSAAAASLAAVVLLLGARGEQKMLAAAALATAASLVVVPWASHVLVIPPGKSKLLARLPVDPATGTVRTLSSDWNSLARVDVIDGGRPVEWMMNPRSAATFPPQALIVIDGDAVTPVLRFDGDLASLSFLDSAVPYAALQALRPERVLVIGSGGGLDVLAALRSGAGHVDAVEINPAVVRAVTVDHAELGGRLFEREEVTLHLGEGRSFIRTRDVLYDAIQLSLVDTWAATASGAYSLAESYLYTVEAFEDYLRHLEDDGFVSISRWEWTPPRENLRLVTVAEAALRRMGADDPASHIVVLASGHVGTVVVGRNPLGSAQLAAIARVARAEGFYPVFAPDLASDNPFGAYLRTPDKASFLRNYPFDVSPVHDDRPFFFQFGRWSRLNPFGGDFREAVFVLSGRLVVLTLLVQAGLLSTLLLGLPALVSRQRGARPGKGQRAPRIAPVVGYFVLIGLAFMLVEIALMQRFTLYLGSPLHATALVLGTLLVAAGLGSALSARAVGRLRAEWPVFAGIVLLGMLAVPALPVVFDTTLAWPFAARALASVVLLVPLGILVGMPFPVAMARLVQHGGEGMIGWAWAANGCASVLGPILAVLLAMDLGLGAVLFAGACAYAGAAVTLRRWSRDPA